MTSLNMMKKFKARKSGRCKLQDPEALCDIDLHMDTPYKNES